MRGKWAECAGKVIEAGGRPKFSDLLKFVKHRAKLVNNEFGDLIASPESEEKNKGTNSDKDDHLSDQCRPRSQRRTKQCKKRNWYKQELSSMFRTTWAVEV